jgi:3-oxoacyl-[acyl-carrier protein] reductase
MFKDYKVVVTGSTSGIGLETSRKFIEEGATVIGIGRNFERTKDLGDKFIPLKCNLRDPDDIAKACKFIDETFGGELDTLVNNAGAGELGTIMDFEPDAFDSAFRLLLKAPMLLSRALFPMLKKSPRKNGSIVNTASGAAYMISPDFSPLYSLAKTAVMRYTKQQARGFIGVRANSVSPGFIDTPIFGREGTEMDEATIQETYKTIASITCGRIGKPEEVADLILFLASEDAKYINGTDVIIDGGALTVVS